MTPVTENRKIFEVPYSAVRKKKTNKIKRESMINFWRRRLTSQGKLQSRELGLRPALGWVESSGCKVKSALVMSGRSGDSTASESSLLIRIIPQPYSC